MNSDHISAAIPEIDFFNQLNLSEMYFQVHMVSRPKSTMPTHSHKFWHLIYLTEGELTVQTCGRDYVLHPCSAHIQPAKIPHSLSSNTGYKQLGINFYQTEQLSEAFPRPVTLTLPAMLSFVHEIAALNVNDRFYKEQLIALCDLIIYTTAGAATRHDENPLKRQILEYIERSMEQKFSLSEMADSLFISTSNLERSCRRFFGTGVLALRNRKRFERACTLLTDSVYSVRDVADALGFTEASNFSAFFRHYAGFSPAEYRKRYYE